VLGCTGSATTRLLQLRDPLGMHVHDQGDEILYVVAGEGTIETADASTNVGPGSLSVLPRGMAHAVDRRGRNPLILVSTVAGAPCAAASSTMTANK
jgi:mannose-6-phosphate isomerase-like protein (cupin superfamily)